MFDVVRRCSKLEDVVRRCSDVVRCHSALSDVAKCCPMVSVIVRCWCFNSVLNAYAAQVSSTVSIMDNSFLFLRVVSLNRIVSLSSLLIWLPASIFRVQGYALYSCSN